MGIYIDPFLKRKNRKGMGIYIDGEIYRFAPQAQKISITPYNIAMFFLGTAKSSKSSVNIVPGVVLEPIRA